MALPFVTNGYIVWDERSQLLWPESFHRRRSPSVRRSRPLFARQLQIMRLTFASLVAVRDIQADPIHRPDRPRLGGDFTHAAPPLQDVVDAAGREGCLSDPIGSDEPGTLLRIATLGLAERSLQHCLIITASVR
jgi:hypothetical protein